MSFEVVVDATKEKLKIAHKELNPLEKKFLVFIERGHVDMRDYAWVFLNLLTAKQ